MIVWVDESGFNRRNTIRAYGYSLRGMCAIDHQLKHGGVRINSIGIMSYLGVEDVYILEDTVDGDVFEDFCRKCLIPLLMPFNGINTHSVVVMDNCSVHHVNGVVEMIHSTGALLRFLPPYSPDLNPIELVFSKVKAFVRATNWSFNIYPTLQFQWLSILLLNKTAYITCNIVVICNKCIYMLYIHQTKL